MGCRLQRNDFDSRTGPRSSCTWRASDKCDADQIQETRPSNQGFHAAAREKQLNAEFHAVDGHKTSPVPHAGRNHLVQLISTSMSSSCHCVGCSLHITFRMGTYQPRMLTTYCFLGLLQNRLRTYYFFSTPDVGQERTLVEMHPPNGPNLNFQLCEVRNPAWSHSIVEKRALFGNDLLWYRKGYIPQPMLLLCHSQCPLLFAYDVKV